MGKSTKFIIFDNLEQAENFKKLYGGSIHYYSTSEYFHRYFDIEHTKYIVSKICTTNDFEEIRSALVLKKTRRKGHLCYIYH